MDQQAALLLQNPLLSAYLLQQIQFSAPQNDIKDVAAQFKQILNPVLKSSIVNITEQSGDVNIKKEGQISTTEEGKNAIYNLLAAKQPNFPQDSSFIAQSQSIIDPPEEKGSASNYESADKTELFSQLLPTNADITKEKVEEFYIQSLAVNTIAKAEMDLLDAVMDQHLEVLEAKMSINVEQMAQYNNFVQLKENQHSAHQSSVQKLKESKQQAQQQWQLQQQQQLQTSTSTASNASTSNLLADSTTVPSSQNLSISIPQDDFQIPQQDENQQQTQAPLLQVTPAQHPLSNISTFQGINLNLFSSSNSLISQPVVDGVLMSSGTASANTPGSEDGILTSEKPEDVLNELKKRYTGDVLQVAQSKKKKKNFTKESTELLNIWFFSHLSDPYPTDEEKKVLAAQTGLSLNQVNNWFGNKRMRYKRKMLEQGKTPRIGGSDSDAQGFSFPGDPSAYMSDDEDEEDYNS